MLFNKYSKIVVITIGGFYFKDFGRFKRQFLDYEDNNRDTFALLVFI